MYRPRRGLGYNPQIGSGGQVVDCDSFSGLFQGVCWNPAAPGLPIQAVPDPNNPTGPPIYQPATPSGVVDSSAPLLSSFSFSWATVAVVGGVALVALMFVGGRGRR
jgi:hypothetical protein